MVGSDSTRVQVKHPVRGGLEYVCHGKSKLPHLTCKCVFMCVPPSIVRGEEDGLAYCKAILCVAFAAVCMMKGWRSNAEPAKKKSSCASGIVESGVA